MTWELTAENWFKKFKRHFDSECTGGDSTTERSAGQTDGILPRSNRRSHIRRWPELAAKIDASIRAPEYAATVEKFLTVRQQRGNPTPHFFALMAVCDLQARVLTEQAKASAAEIANIVGADFVHVIKVRGDIVQQNKLQVIANEIPLSK